MTALVRTLLLAGSFSEAAKYAKGRGLKQYRYAVNAQSVATFRPDDIVELPGYESRRDKHAFKSVIRLAAARGVEVRKDEYIPPPPPPAPQYGELGYLADPLFGDAEKLRELGASEGEVKTLGDIAAGIQAVVQDVADAIVGVQDLKQQDFVESDPQDAVVAISELGDDKPLPAKPRPKRRVTPGPPATPADLKAAKANLAKKTVTSEVDDLFED